MFAAAREMDKPFLEVTDERLSWLNGLGNRRALVAVALLTAGAFAFGLVAERNGVLIGAAALYVACLLLARRAVRRMTEVPDERLDERQLALRNTIYRESYIWLGVLVALGCIAALVAYGFSELPVQRAHMYGFTLTTYLLMFSLPTLVYAWRVPDV